MSGNEVCFLDGEECFGGKTENVVKTCEFCNEVKMCGQVSMSPTFYEQIFCAKVFFVTFL